MQIAVISDIHGNGVALGAVLQELEANPVDQVVCLGDALQGGCQPAQVAEQLQRIGCPIIMGNADSWLVTGKIAGEPTDIQREVREWTLSELGDQGLAFLGSFVESLEVELEDAELLLCFHGSPRSFDEVLLPETPKKLFEEVFASSSATYLTGGHTHLQWNRRLGQRYFFNPGSVGVAYNRLLPQESFFFYPLAEYAVLSNSKEGTSIEFRHILLDPDKIVRAIIQSGQPHAQTEAKRYEPPA